MPLCCLLDVLTGTTASLQFQGAPVNLVTAMETWTSPFLAAVIQSQASVCAVAKATVAHLVRVALKVITEMPSQPGTVNVSIFTKVNRNKRVLIQVLC